MRNEQTKSSSSVLDTLDPLNLLLLIFFYFMDRIRQPGMIHFGEETDGWSKVKKVKRK